MVFLEEALKFGYQREVTEIFARCRLFYVSKINMILNRRLHMLLFSQQRVINQRFTTMRTTGGTSAVSRGYLERL